MRVSALPFSNDLPRNTGQSAKCRVRYVGFGLSESTSITKDAKVGDERGTHPHDSKDEKNGNLQVYIARILVWSRYSRAAFRPRPPALVSLCSM